MYLVDSKILCTKDQISSSTIPWHLIELIPFPSTASRATSRKTWIETGIVCISYEKKIEVMLKNDLTKNILYPH